MRIKIREFNRQRGAALILVVVVTVLLAVVGVMFLMVSRLSEMETAAVADSRDLNAAVQTVISRVDEVLVEDLFGNNNMMIDDDGSDESYDTAGTSDSWLCSLEPDASAGYQWNHITDLYDSAAMDPNWTDPLATEIILSSENAEETIQADADGDGVADSRWVKVPGLTTSRGRDVFAAVRIIDNCAMLNLNVAHCFYQGSYADGTSFFESQWYEDNATATPYYNNQTGAGRYLSEINYLPFLRGHDLNGNSWEGTPSTAGDDWYNLMLAKGFWDTVNDLPFTPQDAHNVLMNIEDMGSAYQFFDIGDELEIRNRYLVTSRVEARFEQADVANYSLDSGSTDYAALQVPRDNSGNPISIWYERVEPANFDTWSGWLNPSITTIPYKYDRRHVCTFYSFDRNLRKGQYPKLLADLVASGLTQERIEEVGSVLLPLGAVTTDIEDPDSVQPYNNVETRKRILHLLFALREYYYQQNGGVLDAAALSAAQIVANMIDYTDDNAIYPTAADRQGPFYCDGTSAEPYIDYGAQANVDCTYITEQIIEDMIFEASENILGVGNGFTLDFGLAETVFGYERQPFISEVYAYRNPDNGGALEGFAIELLNPYPEDLKLYRDDTAYNPSDDVWRIKVGDGLVINVPIADMTKYVPKYANNTPGRYVIRMNTSVNVLGSPLIPLTYEAALLGQINTPANKEIQLLRPAPANSGVSFIVVDSVSDGQVVSVLTNENQNAIKRQDTLWKFIYPSYDLQQEGAGDYTHTLGQQNGVTTGLSAGFQLAVPDDQNPLARWHDLEVLSLYGNDSTSSDPNITPQAITEKIASRTPKYLDLKGTSAGLLNYVCTINRPDRGTLPGRININTAPVHVIAAAIPPSLADPNIITAASSGYSALDLAQDIVAGRPYTKLSDLLNISRFKQYDTGGAWASENVGTQSIDNDIEERDWVLSNLANKFTVRSDVFTAYILVRLGDDGPQQRMIAIFDRSNVWNSDDWPERVALHPVPDSR